MTWPLGDAHFTVDDLLAAGRVLDRTAADGLPVDVAQALEVVDTLSAYVASLPAGQQQETVRRLVEALVVGEGRKDYAVRPIEARRRR